MPTQWAGLGDQALHGDAPSHFTMREDPWGPSTLCPQDRTSLMGPENSVARDHGREQTGHLRKMTSQGKQTKVHLRPWTL